MVRSLQIGLISVLACVGFQPAHAAPQSASFKVKGTVGTSCSLDSVSMSPSVTLATSGTGSNAVQTITKNNPSSWSIPGHCNVPSTLSISATSLRRSNPSTSLGNNQSQTLNYTATASGWTTSAATVTTNDTAIGTTTVFPGTAQTQSSAKATSVSVSYGTPQVATSGASGNKIVPFDGSYSATITLSLAAN